MQWLRFYTLKIALFLLGVTISLSACQKGGGSSQSGGSTPAAPTPATGPVAQSGGGGIDGSGGDSVHSSLEQVKKAVADEIGKLQPRLGTMKMNYETLDDMSYDYQFGRGARKLVGEFLLMSQVTRKGSPLWIALESKAIQIKPQLEACQSQNGKRTGSAKGNYITGEICISYQELRRISPFSLNHEIFNLLIHELSHLSGFDESKAVEIQNLVYENRLIYSTFDESGFINGLKSCDRKAIEKETKEMEESPYWQEQKRKLVELLSGEQPRGCGPNSNKMTDRVDIFSDDAEFLTATRKFPRSGYRWQVYDKARGVDGTHIYCNSIQEISFVASIALQTSTAWIELDAQIGSDAQCSPKIFMANLIANIPDVLKLNCGAGRDQVNTLENVRIRIQKEKEILDGAPKN